MKAKSSPNDPATKSDISDTKTELRSEIRKTEKTLRVDISKVEKKVSSLEEKLDIVEEKLDSLSSVVTKIYNLVVGFAGRVDDLTNDNEIGTEQIRDLQEKARNHEKRIVKLESRN